MKSLSSPRFTPHKMPKMQSYMWAARDLLAVALSHFVPKPMRICHWRELLIRIDQRFQPQVLCLCSVWTSMTSLYPTGFTKKKVAVTMTTFMVLCWATTPQNLPLFFNQKICKFPSCFCNRILYFDHRTMLTWHLRHEQECWLNDLSDLFSGDV